MTANKVFALRFSSAVIATLLIAVILFILSPPENLIRSVPHHEAVQSTGIENVRYGYRGDELLYIIFESTYMQPRYPPEVFRAGGVDTVLPGQWINLPDGTRRELPKSKMIFQSRFGAFTNRPLDVSLEQFKSFLASRPSIYSIEGLEAYVQQKDAR